MTSGYKITRCPKKRKEFKKKVVEMTKEIVKKDKPISREKQFKN